MGSNPTPESEGVRFVMEISGSYAHRRTHSLFIRKVRLMDEATHPWMRLLSALKYYAPDNRAKWVCSRMVNNAFKEGCTRDEVAIMLSGSITDGLRHGNWPWIITP